MISTRILLFTAVLTGTFFNISAENYRQELTDSIPMDWTYTSDFTPSDPSTDQWWKQFSDPVLDALIELGIRNNYNVAVAAQRMAIAKEAVNSAKSGYYPTVDLNVGWTRERSSGMMAVSNGHSSVTSYFNFGATMNWEIDLFGKIRSGVKAQEAQYAATRAEYDGVMVSMAAELALTYINLRLYQQELVIAAAQTADQARTLKITEARLEAGLGNGLEVAQTKTLLYATQATVPTLEYSVSSAINQLAILTGLYPAELKGLLERGSHELPDYRRIIGVGVPMDLLRRRPDIIQAEQQLASYAAQLGVAKKDFLPVLSLEGTIGTEVHNLKDMFGKESFAYSIAPTLTWTIFDGFSRKANKASMQHQMQMGIDNYNQTVLTAVTEVEDAMASYKSAIARISMLQSCVEQNDKALTLSLNLYKQGLAAFTNVIDAQTSLLQYQNQLAECKAQALSSLINVYKALGGGFN